MGYRKRPAAYNGLGGYNGWFLQFKNAEVEAYLGQCQTFIMKLFAKIVNGWKN